MRRYRWSLDKTSFWLGVGGSLLVFIIFSSLLISTMVSHGVTVYLNSDEIATTIEKQVVLYAQQEVPQLINDAKAEIPGIVESEMQQQLSDRMEIAGFVFTMPAELSEQISKYMKINVENTTGKILDGLNTHILADKFGNNVYDMVKQTITEQLQGQTMRVYLFERIPISVNLQVK